MTTADWALVVSIFSLVVSFGGFIWNVWSKFIYPKPRLAVHFAINQIIPDDAKIGSFLALSATNHGPISVTLTHAVVQFYSEKGGVSWGLLNASEHPDLMNRTGFSTALPKELNVGERYTVYFPFTAEGFVREHLKRVGFSDIFGRNHWASRRSVKKVTSEYETRFGPVGAKSFQDSEVTTASGSSRP